jgi:hypothetical protein
MSGLTHADWPSQRKLAHVLVQEAREGAKPSQSGLGMGMRGGGES